VDALERRYRRLLLAYPAEYRRERGDELVGILLDDAAPGRTRPEWREAADLVLGGLRRRAGLDVVPGLAAGARNAAPYALALAAALSGFLLLCFEGVPRLPVFEVILRPLRPASSWPTVGIVSYLCWLYALGAYSLGRPATARTALGLATAASATVPLLAAAVGLDRPPLWTVGTLTAFGLIALVGYRPPPTHQRAITAACAVTAAVGATALLALRMPDRQPGWHGYYQPAITISGLLVAAALAVVLLRAVRARPATPWLWAALLIGLPGAWLGPWRLEPQTAEAARAANAAGDADWFGFGAPHFGRLAQTLLGACVVVVAMGWLRERLALTAATAHAPGPTGARPRLRRLGRAARAATGWAGGLSAFLWYVDAGPLAHPVFAAWLLAATATALPLRARRLAVTLALAVTALAPLCAVLTATAGPRPAVTGALLALGVVGLAGTFLPPAEPDRAGARLARQAGAAAWAAAGAVAVGVYDNAWSLRDWSDPGRTAILTTTLALVPLSLAAAAAVRALPSRNRPLWTILAATAAWTGALAVPHLSSWGPVLLLATAAAIAAGPLALLRRTGT